VEPLPAILRESPAGKLSSETQDPRFMLSLARGLLVLHAFEQSHMHTLASVSRLTGLPRATVRRCLFTLQKLGYVNEVERGFTLTRKVLSLATLFHQATDVLAQVLGSLRALTRTTGEQCVFGTLDGEDALILARAAPSGRIVSFNFAKRIPLHCSALGRACLASGPAERVEEFLQRAPFARLTDKTKCSAKELRAAIETTRESGYAVVEDELEPGLKSIAVAVYESAQKAVGAVSVVTVRSLTRNDLKALLEHIQASAREIGGQLAAGNLSEAEILDLGGSERGVEAAT
jgi:IclR family transcriptional regulator, pca regulon regulatory protein